MTPLHEMLENLYQFHNKREYVSPDPLQSLYEYPDCRNREIAGFLASSLAYGRVAHILKSISIVLGKMNHAPFEFLKTTSRAFLNIAFAGFSHRFTTGKEVADFCWGIKKVIEKYGSLHACFCTFYRSDAETVLPSLTAFTREIRSNFSISTNSLLPYPEKGSACKRLNLFLRWMVRQDNVDPGGWEDISTSKLIVPLDTHLHRVSLSLSLTERKQASMETALEITRALKTFDPSDPVRFDFALTRPGIWKTANCYHELHQLHTNRYS